jgi:GTP-binding protein Era
MMDFVKSAFDDADVLIYMVEVGEKELKMRHFLIRLFTVKYLLFYY